MKFPVLMTMTFGICALSATAVAQVPALLPVQGQLTDEQEAPLTGDVQLSFSLYEQAEGGTAFFESTRTLTLSDGTFSVYLGESQALDFRMFPASGQVFIGLVVDGGEELSPRIQIGTVPYAARASICEEAQTLAGATAQDFATVDHTHDYSELTGVPTTFPPSAHRTDWSELDNVPATFPPSAHRTDWSELDNVPADLADGDSDTLAALSCAAGELPQSNGASGWTCASSDPVAAVAAADSYVRNNGDTITGDVVIQGATTLEQAVTMNGRVTMTGRMIIDADVETRAGDTAIDLDQEGRKYVVHYTGAVGGGASARIVSSTKIERYCGDIDGCTISLIEAGYTAGIGGVQLPRRRATGPHTFMTDTASRFWSLDNAGAGRQGQWGNTTVSEVITIGECAFTIDQDITTGTRFDFSVVKKVADAGGRSRICTLVIRD